jgi:hypothetical protein
MPMRELRPLLAHILLNLVIQRMSSTFNKKDYSQNHMFLLSYKLLTILYSQLKARGVCKPNQVFFIDISLVFLRLNQDYSRPFVDKLQF